MRVNRACNRRSAPKTHRDRPVTSVSVLVGYLSSLKVGSGNFSRKGKRDLGRGTRLPLFWTDIPGNESSYIIFLKCVKKQISFDLTQFNYIFLNPTTWRYSVIIYFIITLDQPDYLQRARSGFSSSYGMCGVEIQKITVEITRGRVEGIFWRSVRIEQRFCRPFLMSWVIKLCLFSQPWIYLFKYVLLNSRQPSWGFSLSKPLGQTHPTNDNHNHALRALTVSYGRYRSDFIFSLQKKNLPPNFSFHY